MKDVIQSEIIDLGYPNFSKSGCPRGSQNILGGYPRGQQNWLRFPRGFDIENWTSSVWGTDNFCKSQCMI